MSENYKNIPFADDGAEGSEDHGARNGKAKSFPAGHDDRNREDKQRNIAEDSNEKGEDEEESGNGNYEDTSENKTAESHETKDSNRNGKTDDSRRKAVAMSSYEFDSDGKNGKSDNSKRNGIALSYQFDNNDKMEDSKRNGKAKSYQIEDDEGGGEPLLPRPLYPPPVIITPPPPDQIRISRKNSISLPANLDSLQFTISPGDSICDDTRSEDDAYSETDDEEYRAPLRSLRRKSVMPMTPNRLQVPNSKFIEYEPDKSPHHSMTSLNSISSLVKDKILSTFPGVFDSKHPKLYKTKAFVALCFLIVVFLLGFGDNLYRMKVIQRPYFDWIRFNIKVRTIYIHNGDGELVLRGIIGTTLNDKKMYKCLSHHRILGSECMEWMNLARLYLSRYKRRQIDCYNIHWESLYDGDLLDCYEVSPALGHWYGGGVISSSPWPLEQRFIDPEPFITSDMKKHQWGNVLRRSFYNTKGVAIIVDPITPFHFSMHSTKENMFCLQAKRDDYAFLYNISQPLTLNYSICTSTDYKMLHYSLAQKNLWGNLAKKDMGTIDLLLTEPVWQITPFDGELVTKEDIYNYTDEIEAHRFFRHGHLLMNERWESNVGDLTLDSSRFPLMENVSDLLYRRGFRTIFKIQPFISIDSFNFHDAMYKEIFVSERDSENYVPALTKLKNIRSAGVLDITNNDTVYWLEEKLRKLVDDNKIDALFIDYGSGYGMPRHYKFERDLTSVDEYMTVFTQTIQNSFKVVGVSGAIECPKPPAFVSLPAASSSWESLKAVIPTILTYGINGYPLIIPGAIGGDYYQLEQASNTTDNVTVVEEIPLVNLTFIDRELYSRWLQLAMFLPVVRYTHPPSRLGDEILKMAEDLTSLRTKIVNPLLLKFVREALNYGIPIIRPLWMIDPQDHLCQTISDQFAIGDEVIVAPILEAGDVERDVYLPAGMWKDGIVGNLRKGKRWLHDYRVGSDKIAYFTRISNNTRT